MTSSEKARLVESGLTHHEADIVLLTVQLWNECVHMDKCDHLHDCDMKTIESAIHAIQSLILSRPAYRKYVAAK